MKEDDSLDNLLLLHGERFVVDEKLGLWVKFEAKVVTKTTNRPHGIKYSLSLHNRKNARVMGFDNSHAIEYGSKNMVSPKRTFDHWHIDENDKGHPYSFQGADMLLQDFWKEVDRVIAKLQEGVYE